MDGLTAARAICAGWPKEQRPYLIALTAHVTPEYRAACLEAGMDAYLSKPIDIDELTRSLQACQPRAAAIDPAAPCAAQPRAGADDGLHASDAILERWRSMLGPQQMPGVHGVIEQYLEDTNQMVAAMDDALNSAKHVELGHAAHKLASSSAIIGAAALAANCQQLELAAAAHATERARQLLDLIKTDYADIAARLQRASAADSPMPAAQHGRADVSAHD
jgi:HPt (histidine-containing phosphotransfer) domain-containing protein